LQFLLLEDGVISGEIPSELGLLSQLEVIDMNFNFLRGSLPDSLFGLAQLRQLDLNDNTITGTISSEFGRLPRLEFLQLQKNMLTGTIPSELGELQQLGKDTILGFLWHARGCTAHHWYRPVIRTHSLPQRLPHSTTTNWKDPCRRKFASYGAATYWKSSRQIARQSHNPRDRHPTCPVT
jgi:hypothetical protein